MDSDDNIIEVIVSAILFLAAIVSLGYTIVSATTTKADNTWEESTEYTQLDTGQDRFSLHNTNVKDFPVIVDHETGIIYMRHVGVLVDENGESLRVSEVGE